MIFIGWRKVLCCGISVLLSYLRLPSSGNNDFIDILRLSELLLQHKHDLMRKAIGWMLREMGKRDKTLLLQFLDKYSKVMPRTMLRYSIEKLTDEERKLYMGR